MIDHSIKALKEEIEGIKAQHARLRERMETLIQYYRSKTKQDKRLAAELERGDDSCRSYADWTKTQMSERPELLVQQGGNAPPASGKW